MKKLDVWTVTMVLALVLGLMVFPWQAPGQLTASRDTPAREGVDVGIGVKTATTIYRGAMVAVDASGWAVPASDTAGLRVVGRAQSTVVNAGANGAETIVVRRGIFRWANGDTFTRADVGTLAYIEDDATVQKAASATHDIPVGTIIDVDSDGVWVDTYVLPSHGSATVVNLTATGNAAVTGNATVGGTLAVTGNSTLSGTGRVVGNFDVNTNKFTVNASTGNATVAGTLVATGASTSASHTSAGLVKGGTLGIGDGVLIRIGDALSWVEGGITNVVVADVTQ